MSSKREVFQLISYDIVCKNVVKYTVDFASIIESEVVSVLHSILPWLKNSVEFQRTQTSPKEMQFKVLALLNGMVGYVAEESEKKKENALRFVFGESEEGPVKLLNTQNESWVDLEGSSPDIMLPIQLFILVRYYYFTHYNEPELILISGVLIEKEVILESLLDEILIVANAAHIYNKYKSIVKEKSMNALNDFVMDFIASLKKQVGSNSFNLKELSFPCGFDGHFMYLTILKYSGDKLVFRYDNLGPGCEKHSLNQVNKKPVPYTLFEVMINNLESIKDFILMLCQQKFASNASDVIDKLYGIRTLSMSSNEVQEWNSGYQGLDKQMVGNCVFASLIIGMRYRWDSYLGAAPDAAFVYLMNNIAVNTVLSGNLSALAQGVSQVDHVLNMRNDRRRQKQMNIKRKRFSSEPYENDPHVPMISSNSVLVGHQPTNNPLMQSRDSDYDPQYLLNLQIKFLFEEQRDILDFFTPPQFKYNGIVSDLSNCFVKDEGDKNKSINRFIVLGDTGCGKTILSKFITYLWINERHVANYEWVHNYDLVIRISLREVSQHLLKDNMDVDDLFKIVCFPHLDRGIVIAKTRNKKTLILLDGLDEIYSLLRKNTSVLDKSLLYKLIFNPKFTVLIFSRPFSIRYNAIDKLPVITIQKFNYINVVKYVNKFFKPSNIDSRLVVKSIYRNISLRTLIRNPLLLEVFCSLLNLKKIILDDEFVNIQFESSMLYKIALGIKLKTENTEDFLYCLLSELAWYLKDNKKGHIPYDKFQEILDRLGVQNVSANVNVLENIGLVTIFKSNSQYDGCVYLERTFQDYLSAIFWSKMFIIDRESAKQKYDGKNLEKMFFLIWKHSLLLLDDKSTVDFINMLIADSDHDNMSMQSIAIIRLIYAISEFNLKAVDPGIFKYACFFLFTKLRVLFANKYDKDVISEAFAQCPVLVIKLLENSYNDLSGHDSIETFWDMVNYFNIRAISDNLIDEVEKNTKFKNCTPGFLNYLSKSYIQVLSQKNQYLIVDLLSKCFNGPLCEEICLNLSENFLLGISNLALRVLISNLFIQLKYSNKLCFYVLLKSVLKYSYIYEAHEVFSYFCEFFNELGDIEMELYVAENVLDDLMREGYLISFVENYVSKKVDESAFDCKGFCKLIPFLEFKENGIKITSTGVLVTSDNNNISQPASLEFRNNLLGAKYHEIVYFEKSITYDDSDYGLILYYKANDPLVLYFKILSDQKLPVLEEVSNTVFETLKCYCFPHCNNCKFEKTADFQTKVKLANHSEVNQLVMSVRNNMHAWHVSWLKTNKNKCVLM